QAAYRRGRFGFDGPRFVARHRDGLAGSSRTSSQERAGRALTDLRATATVDKRQRLHPLSPILRSLKAIGVIIAAISWQGFEQFGVYTVLIGVAAAAFVGLVWSWIAWHFMGYTIIGTELHISDGVISRRQRTIPLQRLQSVEVVQPFVGRLLG